MGAHISSNQVTKNQETDSDTAESSKKSHSFRQKEKQGDPNLEQKLKHEEPSFSSSLNTPIEEVISETLRDCVDEPTYKYSQQTSKIKVDDKDKLKETNSTKHLTKDKKRINSKSVDLKKCSKSNKKVISIEKSEETNFHSFVPVKHGKNKKNKTSVVVENNIETTKESNLKRENQNHSPKTASFPDKIQQEDNKVEKCGEDALKTIIAKGVKKSTVGTDIIEHYKTKKNKHQAVIEPLPTVTRKFSDSLERIQNFVVVNKLEESSCVESEPYFKSKNSSPFRSYASVLSNEQVEQKLNETSSKSTINPLELSIDASSIELIDKKELFIENSYNLANEITDTKIIVNDNILCSAIPQGPVNNIGTDPNEIDSKNSYAENNKTSLEIEPDKLKSDQELLSKENCSLSVCRDNVDTIKFINIETGETKNLQQSGKSQNHSCPSNNKAVLSIKNYANNFLHQEVNDNTLEQKSSVCSINCEQLKDKENTDIQNSDHIKKQYLSQISVDTMEQTRILTLNDKEHLECTLYRLEKSWTLQFRIGPSLFGRKIYLYCNYPIDNNEFVRNKYYLVPWKVDEGCKHADDTACYANILVKIAGSFHYFFTFSESSSSTREGSGYFLVDPLIKYGNNEHLPLDCIQCQTVLAKSLGSFSTWENKLRVTKESGYNMIHFTPIQELGESNSSYSLSEQLKLNPCFKKTNLQMPTFVEIEKFIDKIRNEWKISSICDVVLNHTANESLWIQEHPEVTYNCSNCPYMRPAYLLDAALYQFSMDIKNGLYEDKGIPKEVNSEDHLNAIRYHFRTNVLEPLNIPELFICDVKKYVIEFLTLARNKSPCTSNSGSNEELILVQDPQFKRLASTINMELALELYNVYRNDTFDEESRIKKCAEDFKIKLEHLNRVVTEEINSHLNLAIENVIAGIRYFRVQADGPKFTEITIKTPLVYRYFTDFGKPKCLKDHETDMYNENGRFIMAHNGWVMNSDPLKNFAASDSKVFLRRELIAWGDSVKLRFGEKPEDCPFLWDHMRKYVEQTAKIFDGVRLDNCHSTPIPVAKYLLDCARKVRPDLYVVAELFTNSDRTDNIFVNRLGITSLIREAMSAWDSHEEGRLVYRYGGYPVGAFYQPNIRPLVPSVAHALFLDLTHDNPSPVEKRSVFDLLPSTALVNMACCASGSNRGYDELVPHHIHVVDETREYTEWNDHPKATVGNAKYVNSEWGIISAKKALNDLHFTLGQEGYTQVYVDQMDPDIVAVTRHCPNTHQSYILVAFTAFSHPNEDAGNHQRGIKPLRFEGVLDEIVIEATLSHVYYKNGGSKFKFYKYTKDNKYINGLTDYYVSVKKHIKVKDSDIFETVDSGSLDVTQLNFKNFKPGSIVVLKTSLPVKMKAALNSLRNLLCEFSEDNNSELSHIINNMSLVDLNRALFRCDREERDEGYGFDTYNIPAYGFMVYAGLQGMISLLTNIRPHNDLGHPMCANLRDGNWMIDYTWRRLQFDEGTKALGDWIEEKSINLKSMPRYLIPCYFDVFVTGIYNGLLERCYELMKSFVKNGSTFVKSLSLGSVQMTAYIKSAELPTLSPNLAPPKPRSRRNEKGEEYQACVSLSAGLPHFSTGYMRNWGRDTFIAMRGLFILTERFQEAREHILAFGACLRHGLIPNLLDGGRNPRYNCRDAVWWWLYCIKEYVEEAPKGLDILSDKVSRIFPKDDSPNQPPGAVDQYLYDVMQEALNVHFQGLIFRERNAGRQIDEHMTDQGFNNQIGIHPETGFVFGGNQWNCGTWMDKMGSSEKAGTRGKPATPRDGSAIELIGLSKSVADWLHKLHTQNKYPYSGVERTHKNGSVTKWSFEEWSKKIQANFEKHFWINTVPVPGEQKPELINKRGIYKDSYGSSQAFADFQLRCNFPIAMVVAPQLFSPERAWTALSVAEKYLLGPLGMKTLDPEDWAYRGDYDNSNDSCDPSVAHGLNYHQGPEWVWPVGYFLRAKLLFAQKNGALEETISNTKLILSKHFVELQKSDWRGLPELTNSNGSYCKDSCRTQAWSFSSILEVLHDLQKIESSQASRN